MFVIQESDPGGKLRLSQPLRGLCPQSGPNRQVSIQIIYKIIIFQSSVTDASCILLLDSGFSHYRTVRFRCCKRLLLTQ
jgi:hypothetical protein